MRSAHPEQAFVYLPELFLARRAADAAPATPPATWLLLLLLNAFGCRGGGDPFVGVELSEERPESRPSSPTAFSRLGAELRVRDGRPVRLLAPFESSGSEEAILSVSGSQRSRVSLSRREHVVGLAAHQPVVETTRVSRRRARFQVSPNKKFHHRREVPPAGLENFGFALRRSHDSWGKLRRNVCQTSCANLMTVNRKLDLISLFRNNEIMRHFKGFRVLQSRC